MKRKPVCFVVCPIGEPGSDIRRDADDLLELIIKPALDIYGFDVVRGDHRSEANQIDVDVIRSVQESELCIVDISSYNPNVYYELGRRDETGKPVILLRRKDAEEIPVDIGTRRYIEYDLDSRRGIGDSRQQLRNFVEPLLSSDFMSNTGGASLSELAAILQRLERKVDRLTASGNAKPSGDTVHRLGASGNGTDPRAVFQLAARQRNIPLMEEALDTLQACTPRWDFIDRYVEIAAARGSLKAGEMLTECASEFVDESSLSFRKKVEFLGCFVSFLNRTDRELDHLELVEELCNRLLAVSDGEADKDVAQIHNQRNRLYHGIYMTTNDQQWLRKAIQELERAREIVPEETYPWYNLAVCYRHLPEHLNEALSYIDTVLQMDEKRGKEDVDHLETACKIYRDLGDYRFAETLEKLRAVNPVVAALLESN